MPKILVIDDEENFRTMMNILLSREGYQVDSAENGLVGFRMLGNDTYDLVMVDVLMPEMDGLEVIQRLQSQASKIPVIAISGGGQHGMNFLSSAKAFGALYALNKPFPIGEMLALVKKALATDE